MNPPQYNPYPPTAPNFSNIVPEGQLPPPAASYPFHTVGSNANNYQTGPPPAYHASTAPPPNYYQPPPNQYAPMPPNANPVYDSSAYGGGIQPAPVMRQPQNLQGTGDWMPTPQVNTYCPPGLEYLTRIDQLLVSQKVELLEAFTGFETKNKFVVRNSMGQKIYTAKEDSDCCTRNLCGHMRGFDMKIKDNSDTEVIHLNRQFACDSCLFPCCLQKMEVFSPPGTLIGFVSQKWSMCEPSFTVENQSGDVILRVEGPLCTYSMCGDVEFKVLTADGQNQVGTISKQWSGLIKETFTDADNFGITFPMELDVRVKATLLGACFLIDAMFFEKDGNNERDGIGML